MKSEGHAAVVTGGGSGLGEAVARELAKRVVSKDGQPAPLADFKRVAEVNLIGSENRAACSRRARRSLQCWTTTASAV